MRSHIAQYGMYVRPQQPVGRLLSLKEALCEHSVGIQCGNDFTIGIVPRATLDLPDPSTFNKVFAPAEAQRIIEEGMRPARREK